MLYDWASLAEQANRVAAYGVSCIIVTNFIISPILVKGFGAVCCPGRSVETNLTYIRLHGILPGCCRCRTRRTRGRCQTSRSQ